MAKMKPGQISAKRAYEISDSLSKNANASKYAGNLYMKGANAMQKREEKSGKQETMILDPSRKIGDAFELTGNKAVRAFGTSMLNRATANSEKATRLKTRADAAMAKANAAVGRDTPLPSSEGMMSKIANGLSTLFNK
jgi:hypothetical protein